MTLGLLLINVCAFLIVTNYFQDLNYVVCTILL